MHAAPALAETSEIELPPDLIAALKHKAGVQQKDFHVENWKPTLFARFVNLFARKAR
jgi:hypothetical protein